MINDWLLNDEGILTIEGNGRLPDFRESGNPDFCYWYNDRESVRKVIIGEGITEVGTRAFENCANLTEVVLPSSLVRIRAYAFRNCTSLQRIDAGGRDFRYVYDKSEASPDSTPILFGIESFYGTPWARDYFDSFYRSDNVLYICFENQAEIKVPKGVKRISSFAFQNIKAEKLILPESLKKIDDHAFLNARFAKIVMPTGMSKFRTNCASGELRDSLGLPKSVGKDGTVRVPSLYELKLLGRKQMEPFGKLKIGPKCAPLDENKQRTGLWGREIIDIGTLIYRRLKRGGILIGVLYDEDQVSTIYSFAWDLVSDKPREFIAHPRWEGDEIGFHVRSYYLRDMEYIKEAFPDHNVNELIKSGGIRIPAGGKISAGGGIPAGSVKEEWYWLPATEAVYSTGGEAERIFLEKLAKGNPEIIAET